MTGARQLIELGALILGLGLLGTVANRVGISPIPLYLLGGLAFGHGGIAAFDVSEDFIEIGAEIGVILLLLTLGLEYTGSELVYNLRRSAKMGVVDIVLNAAPGVIVGWLLGWGIVGAVALGGITYVSSSGVVAKLIKDFGWQGNRETPTVLSLLVIEDLVMAVYLPILTALLIGAGWLRGSVTLGIAIAVVAAILIIAVRYGRVLERFIASPTDEVLLLKILGLGLLVAGVATQLQVSAAVGAFLVGIALSGPVADLAQERLAPLRDLFAAVFFVFFGFSIDPETLPPVLVIATLLAIVGVGTKFVTGWLAAKQAGVSTGGRARAGASLIARGEFNIVIAGLAVTSGIHPDIGPFAAAYVLILAVVGPLFTRGVDIALDRRRERRRRSALRSRALGSRRLVEIVV